MSQANRPSDRPGAGATFLHEPSDSVRFWVDVDGTWVGASVSRYTLHHRYCPTGRGDEDALETHRAHLAELEAAVRLRVSKGSIEPVMLREFDLRPLPPA